MTLLGSSVDGRYDRAGWPLVRRVIGLKKTLGSRRPSLVDLGMGRGRDLIYFARHGFRVLGIDISPEGLERARRRASRFHIPIRTELGDLRTVRLKGMFEVVYSSCALNHLPATLRAGRFAHFKAVTVPGGIHAVSALVPQPSRRHPPELEPGASLFRPGELRGYYADWEILESGESDFECRWGDVPHRHVVDDLIARKPR